MVRPTVLKVQPLCACMWRRHELVVDHTMDRVCSKSSGCVYASEALHEFAVNMLLSSMLGLRALHPVCHVELQP